MFDLTNFQRDLLYVVAGMDDPSGQDLKSRLEEFLGEMSHGQLYPNLDTLVDEGLLEKGPIDRRTNYYRLTEEGRELLRERREWENEVTGFLQPRQ